MLQILKQTLKLKLQKLQKHRNLPQRFVRKLRGTVSAPTGHPQRSGFPTV